MMLSDDPELLAPHNNEIVSSEGEKSHYTDRNCYVVPQSLKLDKENVCTRGFPA